MKRALPVVLVVSVLLAGCAGVPGTDGTSDDIGPAEIDDAVREQHRQHLQSAGNATYEGTFATASGEQHLDAAFSVSSNRSKTRVTGGGVNTTEFVNESGSYVRSVRDGETRYRYRTAKPDIGAFTVSVIPFNATYERNGTGTVDGVRVAHYTADSAGESMTLGGFAPSELRGFDASVAVTADGFVKRVSWRAETAGGAISYEGTYSALGETAVEAPSWTPKAAANPQTPQVVFGYERSGGALDVQHRGGDALDADAVNIRIEGANGTRTVDWTADGGEIAAGDVRTVENVSAGATVSVRWTANGRTVTLDSYTV